MTKQSIAKMVLVGAVAVTLAACGSAGAGSNNAAAGSDTTGTAIHMDNTKFIPASISIQKGTSASLIADTFVPHIIANGTWENGTAKAVREPGAPQVTDLQINGNGSGTLGPFATTGTFQFHCTIHPGMNLSVDVT
jgi:plastocyanin